MGHILMVLILFNEMWMSFGDFVQIGFWFAKDLSILSTFISRQKWPLGSE